MKCITDAARIYSGGVAINFIGGGAVAKNVC